MKKILFSAFYFLAFSASAALPSAYQVRGTVTNKGKKESFLSSVKIAFNPFSEVFFPRLCFKTISPFNPKVLTNFPILKYSGKEHQIKMYYQRTYLGSSQLKKSNVPKFFELQLTAYLVLDRRRHMVMHKTMWLLL